MASGHHTGGSAKVTLVASIRAMLVRALVVSAAFAGLLTPLDALASTAMCYQRRQSRNCRPTRY